SPTYIFYLALHTTPTPTLYPYTTLFRSPLRHRHGLAVDGEPAPGGQTGGGDKARRSRLQGRRAGHQLEKSHGPGGQIPRQQGHRSEEHTSELQSRFDLVCRLLLEKKKK